MKNKFVISGLLLSGKALRLIGVVLGLCVVIWLDNDPALAHHPMGGKMVSTFLEGFLSGVAHPVIGLDHLAFIVATGLLAVISSLWIPVVFVLAAMLGTGGHLAGLTVPGVELLVSGSVLVVGILLVVKRPLHLGIVAALSALAGLAHGYAYGEAIFGAETTPLVAYLLGFTLIQLGMALAVFWITKIILRKPELDPSPAISLRSAGLVVCGVGLAFLAPQLLGLIVPTSNNG